MVRYTYEAYGLHFESTFPIPELRPATGAAPDVAIRHAAVPATLPYPSAHGIAWQSGPGQMLLTVDDVARYLIVDDREIRVEPVPGAPDVDVRRFLLGSVLGAVLHARHMLVLHASAIETPRGAVLLMGRSGSGKSTLLGSLLQRGHTMIADDKAAIVLNRDGTAVATTGFPLVRLTDASARHLGYPTTGHSIDPRLGKYVLPVTRFGAMPLAVHAAYSIKRHNRAEIQFEPLAAVERFQALYGHTYRRRFVRPGDEQQTHFRLLGALAAQTRVTRLVRPDDLPGLDRLTDQLELDMSR